MSAMRAKALRWLAWSPDNLVFAWEIGRFRTLTNLSARKHGDLCATPVVKMDDSPVFGSGDCPNTPPVLVGLEVHPELRGLMMPKTAVAIVCHRTGHVAQT